MFDLPFKNYRRHRNVSFSIRKESQLKTQVELPLESPKKPQKKLKKLQLDSSFRKNKETQVEPPLRRYKERPTDQKLGIYKEESTQFQKPEEIPKQILQDRIKPSPLKLFEETSSQESPRKIPIIKISLENLTENLIEKPVEKPVEIIKEKPIEKPVEKPFMNKDNSDTSKNESDTEYISSDKSFHEQNISDQYKTGINIDKSKTQEDNIDSFNNDEDVKKDKSENIFNISTNTNVSIKNIYEYFKGCELLVFVNDEKKIVKKWFRKIDIPKTESLLMLSIQCIPNIRNELEILNRKISNNLKMGTNKNNYLKIVFNDDEILPNVLYKKMIIYNSLLFIPLKDYGLKKIEYKIRGFCQLMEELGASTIEIEFIKKKVKTNNLSLNNNVSNKNISEVVGNLGFQLKNTENSDNEQKYILNYSNNTSIILNQGLIEKKIRDGYYIITKWNYSSNLELQYIVASRCQHYIKNYSTNFNLYENLGIDKKLFTSLSAYGINYGLNIEKEIEEINQTVIKTNIIFMDDEYCFNNITGYNVNLDKNGFIYLMKSIQNEDFEKVGIYKIYEFFKSYLDSFVKYKDAKKYKIIKKKVKLLESNFSINDLVKLLLNYFDKNSRWLHLLNFINILLMNTKIYDKLGYILVTNDIKKNNYNIYKYIMNILKKQTNNFENYFIDFEENNLFYYNLIINELKLNNYNMSKLDSIINRIGNFKKEFTTFKDIMHNFHNHNKLFYYLEYIIPYIIKKYNNDEGINYTHIIYYQIGCDEKLDLFYKLRKDRNSNLKVIIDKLYENDKIINDNILNKIKKYTNLDNIYEIKKKYTAQELLDIMINYDINIDFKKIIPDIYGYKLLRKQIKYGNEISNKKNIMDFYNNLFDLMIQIYEEKVDIYNLEKYKIKYDYLANNNYYEIHDSLKNLLLVSKVSV